MAQADMVGEDARWSKAALSTYRALNRNGAPGGTRTPNPLIRSQVLYPLSYGRISEHGED